MKTRIRPFRLFALALVAMSLTACHFHPRGCRSWSFGGYCHAPVVRICR